MRASMSRGIYSVLMYLMVPLFLWRLFRRGFKVRDYWQRWGERFGYSDQPELMDSIWVHAVSVGEVQAAVPLIEHFLAMDDAPRTPLLASTSGRVISRKTTKYVLANANVAKIVGSEILESRDGNLLSD